MAQICGIGCVVVVIRGVVVCDSTTQICEGWIMVCALQSCLVLLPLEACRMKLSFFQRRYGYDYPVRIDTQVQTSVSDSNSLGSISHFAACVEDACGVFESVFSGGVEVRKLWGQIVIFANAFSEPKKLLCFVRRNMSYAFPLLLLSFDLLFSRVILLVGMME